MTPQQQAVHDLLLARLGEVVTHDQISEVLSGAKRKHRHVIVSLVRKTLAAQGISVSSFSGLGYIAERGGESLTMPRDAGVAKAVDPNAFKAYLRLTRRRSHAEALAAIGRPDLIGGSE